MKKISTILLLFLFIFSASSSVNASESYYLSDQSFSKDEYKVLRKQSNSMHVYRNFLKEIRKNDDYTIKYGGAYLENGELIINVKKGVDLEKFKNKYNLDKNQKIKLVDNSSKDLEKDYKTLINLKIDEIKSVKIDDRNNKILVEHNGLNDLEVYDLKTKLKTKNVEFIFTNIKPVTTASYTVYNGTGIDINDDGYDEVTVGFGARNNDTGELGVVTAGHIMDSGYGNEDYMYYADKICGEIDGIQWSGSVDAAFISLRDHWTRFNRFYATDKYMIDGALSGLYTGQGVYSDSVLQGAALYGYFRLSGISPGTVLYARTSATYSGENYTRTIDDMIQTDIVAIKGDSGGSINYYEYPLGEPWHIPYLVSIQSASVLDGNDDWMPGTSYSLSTRVDEILDHLDLTLYNPSFD
jgi:hypothetical protein